MTIPILIKYDKFSFASCSQDASFKTCQKIHEVTVEHGCQQSFGMLKVSKLSDAACLLKLVRIVGEEGDTLPARPALPA